MENKMFQFKTNINCGGCINAITPHLNKAEGIIEWKVDTNNPDKILSVKSNRIKEEEIIKVVEKAGYKIAAIH